MLVQPQLIALQWQGLVSFALTCAFQTNGRLSHGVLGGDWNWGSADAAGELFLGHLFSVA